MILFISHSSGFSGAEKQLMQVLKVFNEIFPERRKVVLLPKSGYLESRLKEFASVMKFPYSWWVIPKNIPIGNPVAKKISDYPPLFFVLSMFLNFLSSLVLSSRLKPDIIWTNTSVVPIGGFLKFLNSVKRREVAHIWHIHEIIGRENPDISSPFGAKIFDLIYSMSDRVVCVSHACANQFRKKDKVRVIYNTVSSPDFAEEIILERLREIKKGEKVIAVIGNITKRKNQILSLKIMERLNRVDRNIKILLVGSWDNEYKLELDKYIMEKGIKNVFFTGFVEDVWSIYRKIHILLITSFVEVNPLSALEGMASGLPVISTNFPGADETITAGFICGGNIIANLEHADEYWEKVADEFAEKILMLFNDYELYRKVSLESMKTFHEKFSPETYRRKIKELMGELGF